MNALEQLKAYKKRFDPIMDKYFDQKIKQAQKIDPLAKQAVAIVKNFTMAGGKRIRPALVYYAYLACGGTQEKEIVKTSIAIELVHSFLLIHDDIIDRDAFRHGVPTVHQQYITIAKRFFKKTNAEHFGNSMAIVSGDLTHSMANEVIFNAKFSSEIILKALNSLQKIVNITIPGEILDVVLEAKGFASEKEIFRMYEGKTARYTFEGPLHLGAVLAGADKNALKAFSDYAIPVGIAFQIRDDILGIFGEEKKLGKPVGSDIIEGKQTLLLVYATKKADKNQKKVIDQCLRNNALSSKDLAEFRKVIVETGALAYAQAYSENLIKQSLTALDKINFQDHKAKQFLQGISNYIIQREQ